MLFIGACNSATPMQVPWGEQISVAYRLALQQNNQASLLWIFAYPTNPPNTQLHTTEFRFVTPTGSLIVVSIDGTNLSSARIVDARGSVSPLSYDATISTACANLIKISPQEAFVAAVSQNAMIQKADTIYLGVALRGCNHSAPSLAPIWEVSWVNQTTQLDISVSAVDGHIIDQTFKLYR